MCIYLCGGTGGILGYLCVLRSEWKESHEKRSNLIEITQNSGLELWLEFGASHCLLAPGFPHVTSLALDICIYLFIDWISHSSLMHSLNVCSPAFIRDTKVPPGKDQCRGGDIVSGRGECHGEGGTGERHGRNRMLTWKDGIWDKLWKRKRIEFVSGASDNLLCRLKHYTSVVGSWKDRSEVLLSQKDMWSYKWLFQQGNQPHWMSPEAILGVGIVEMSEGMLDPFLQGTWHLLRGKHTCTHMAQ